MSASPTCQVRDGAGAYTATTDGFNTTAAGTTTIKLVSLAGVASWSISCIGTDELLVAATINAGLTIDGVAKTCAFTAPAAGSALIFQSTVTDTSGNTTSTTFGIYTLTSSKRVGAVGEATEGSASFGWVTKFNALIRSFATDETNIATLQAYALANPQPIALLNDFGSSTSTAAQSTNLVSATLGASDIWDFEVKGTWSVASGTAGAKLAMLLPTSWTIEAEATGELGTGLDTYHSARITASNTLSTAFNTVAATAEGFRFWGRIKGDGVHTGTITFQCAPGGAVVLTVKAGCTMTMRKVTEV